MRRAQPFHRIASPRGVRGQGCPAAKPHPDRSRHPPRLVHPVAIARAGDASAAIHSAPARAALASAEMRLTQIRSWHATLLVADGPGKAPFAISVIAPGRPVSMPSFTVGDGRWRK